MRVRAILLAVLLLWPVGGFLHAQTAPTLAVVGGTLIDGTGRPPIENAVIVIENGRFAPQASSPERSRTSGAPLRAAPHPGNTTVTFPAG